MDDPRADAARALARALRELEGEDELDEATVQDAFAAVVKLYAGMLERGKPFPPFASGNGATEVTATEVAATASEMLAALHIEVFELGMWQTMGGLRGKGS